ncbi:DUF1622 domain-containing protein [Sphingomicrobium nitratireducens]|uniref:DUF1622 domain-containing protein n=1 Tax=Sphingomicrobium nitratireducens TaxID=2964666 RepID=UPI002240CB83|nr:DUF1622 domain-containing protein [Sphingomicrobium nitratireducens]
MIEEALVLVARVIELLGVAAIVVGIPLSTWYVLRDLNAGKPRKAAFETYRANLGRGILLGLELLVGADIIATITAPLTWESVGLLGLLVLIRTFLSFSLETEIEGVPPWRRRKEEPDEGQVR